VSGRGLGSEEGVETAFRVGGQVELSDQRFHGRVIPHMKPSVNMGYLCLDLNIFLWQNNGMSGVSDVAEQYGKKIGL
jgi:hypothetical protein